MPTQTNAATRRQRGARVPYSLSLTPSTYYALQEVAANKNLPMTAVIFEFATNELKRNASGSGRVYFPDPFSVDVATSEDGSQLFKLSGLRGPDLTLRLYHLERIAEQLIEPAGDFTLTVSPYPDESRKIHIRPRGAHIRIIDTTGWVTGLTRAEAKVLGEAIVEFAKGPRTKPARA